MYICLYRKKVINLLFPKTSLHDYENLCSLACLGTEKNHVKSDDLAYDKSRKQLGCNLEGYYEKVLIWKKSHSLLSDSKCGSIERYNVFKNVRKLR